MENKKVFEIKNCDDCPFMHDSYDDWAVGNDTVISCNLKYFLTKGYSIIDSYKSYNHKGKIKRPDWCPINEKELTFKIKNNEN